MVVGAGVFLILVFVLYMFWCVVRCCGLFGVVCRGFVCGVVWFIVVLYVVLFVFACSWWFDGLLCVFDSCSGVVACCVCGLVCVCGMCARVSKILFLMFFGWVF